MLGIQAHLLIGKYWVGVKSYVSGVVFLFVVRYQKDKAWPEPIWGKFDVLPYTEQGLEITISQLRKLLL
jgi:diadenosine tetraphosphate (Ap4A) HIT family hydrolase